jgi:hypothetical protein
MTSGQTIRVNDRVRVTRDIGELAVRTGDIGVVCSIWHKPTMAYEVEFRRSGDEFGMRTVVFHGQLEAVASADVAA